MQVQLLRLNKFLITYRRLIVKLFQSFEALLAVLLLVGSYVYLALPESAFTFFVLGGRLGQLALLLYAGTLIPGIITRLRWSPLLLVGTMITPFRRHLGISMFMSAVTHFMFVFIWPALAFSGRLRFDDHKIMGLTALLLLFPLWLTSNDQSQRFLGPQWRLLHKLTYAALFFMFFHLLMFNSRWQWIPATFIGLELLSWMTYWRRSTNSPPTK